MDFEAANAVWRLKKALGTWEAVAVRLGVNRGLVWRVAHGKIQSLTVRAALGLPAVPVAVLPCLCGQVHTRGACRRGRQLRQRRQSSEPETLAELQETVVPFLRAREWRTSNEAREN